MSEHGEIISYDGELYLSICDLEGVKHALSSHCDPITCDAMYGLWMVVDGTVNRLRAIQEDIGKEAA